LSQDGSLAIRVTKDAFCKALIKRFGKPIVSTSANLSGEPTPALFNMVSQDIIKGVDYTVQYRQNDMTISASSRIVRILDDGSLDILRS
jgi:L-threonylcarbamoyladenylate synthase